MAQQRVADLTRLVQTRIAAGDPSLSEALELMSFLTNLVGSQHVERFIPVAEPEQQRSLADGFKQRGLVGGHNLIGADGVAKKRQLNKGS